jgi:tRNA (guanine-N7-)-methyltransferase
MIDWSKHQLPERFRHHLSPNNYFARKDLAFEPINYPPLYEKIDWYEHFEDGRPPRYLDIGCGFGWFTMDYSLELKENILGIEIRGKALDYAKSVVKAEGLKNCSFLWYSVVNGLEFLEKGSIAKIFYFFPDPWFKKKHHKRRAFDLEFLSFCYEALESGGELLLQTDIEEVQEYHIATLMEFGKFDFKVLELSEEWNYPRTNKEQECIRNGFEYFRIIAKKTPKL